MNQPMVVQIERSGSFQVGVRGSDARQCGRRGIRQIAYTVRITGDDQHLNADGFIIDNNAIEDYFVRKYMNVLDLESCERIASTACKDFRAMFGKGVLKNVRVSAIEVRIAGILHTGTPPVAGITAKWQRRG